MTSKCLSTPSSNQALAASIGKNTLFGFLGSVLHMLARFLVVPVIIHHLGLNGLGIWAVLMSIAAYMSLGAAGVKSAFQKYVAEATGSGDYDRASRLISTGTAATFLISAVVLVPLAIFPKTLAVAVGVPQTFLPVVSRAFVFLAFTAVLANITQTYQCILMGAHRIDLHETINFVLEPLYALFTIALLYLGFGLLSMCVVFCAYELAGGIVSYYFARRVLPEVHLSPRFISRSVIDELIRFAGSYQLVSMLELLYAAILPVATLKFYGPDAAGVFALAARIVSIATQIQGPYLQATLSGGSLVYASGSAVQVDAFIVKSFKVMLVMTSIPLAFIGLYGTQIVWVWTGRGNPLLQGTILVLCISALFRSVTALCRVLYRISGGAVMDNAQLILALVLAFIAWPLSTRIGFFGMAIGMSAAGQFLGMIVMAVTLTRRFNVFHVSTFAPDVLRVVFAATVIVGASIAASYLGLHWKMNSRMLESVRLLAASMICMFVAVPALLLTGSISRSEARLMWCIVARQFASAA